VWCPQRRQSAAHGQQAAERIASVTHIRGRGRVARHGGQPRFGRLRRGASALSGHTAAFQAAGKWAALIDIFDQEGEEYDLAESLVDSIAGVGCHSVRTLALVVYAALVHEARSTDETAGTDCGGISSISPGGRHGRHTSDGGTRAGAIAAHGAAYQS
jgi:hypothetical protein